MNPDVKAVTVEAETNVCDPLDGTAVPFINNGYPTATPTRDAAPPQIAQPVSAESTTGSVNLNPFDPMNLGISTDYAAAINAEASGKPAEKRKPNDQEYVRVSPQPHHKVTVGAISDKQDMGRVYVIAPPILNEVARRFPKAVSTYELVLTVSLVGAVIVWPVPLAEDRGGKWHSTLRAACHTARSKWTNISSGKGRYDVVTVENPKEIDWESFPPYSEILRQACSEYYIDTLNHPLLRKIAGAIQE